MTSSKHQTVQCLLSFEALWKSMRSWCLCCRILDTGLVFSTILTCGRTVRLRGRREKPACSTWMTLWIFPVIFLPPPSNPSLHRKFADYRLPTVNLIRSLQLDQQATTTSIFTVSLFLYLCVFVGNIALSSSCLEDMSGRIADLKFTWTRKRESFQNCFTLVFVCYLLFAHSFVQAVFFLFSKSQFSFSPIEV